MINLEAAPQLSTGKVIKWGVLAISLLIAITLGGSIIETVQKGTYQIKQAAVSGTMSAHMKPGMYGQFFGDIQTFPKAETFYFTGGTEGSNQGDIPDSCIGVQFNEGSTGDICGTLRVQMPSDGKQAISLVVDQGYRSYDDLEDKLIMPTVRNVLRLTANLMSARESYAEKRADFISYAWDQIQNGMYQTYDVEKVVLDQISGEKVTKIFKEVRKDKNGLPVYGKNPLDGTGIRLANFEVKSFDYSKKVKAQISAQQDAFMAVSTAQAKAKQADQEEKRAEAEGKKAVTTAKYEMEQVKVKAVVSAEQAKEVATLKAQQELEVAKLAKTAAEYTKQQQILLGQGEAARKKAVMVADGALDKKLAVYKEVMTVMAKEFGKQKWVADIQMGGSGKNGGSSVEQFMNILGAKAAKDLNLDMSMQKK